MALSPRVLSASALVVAGAVAAAVVGQLPALGAPGRGFTVTPSSPLQSLVCPGPVVAVGAAGSGADEVTASGRPVRTAGTAADASVRSTPLTRGGIAGGGTAPRLLQAPAARKGGPLAGTQVEQVATGDATGLAAAACTAPTADAWLAAGATTTGRTTVLLLANPYTAPAEATVRVWTEEGPVEAIGGGGEVAVPARSRVAVPLSGLAPSAGGLGVHVTSAGARIGVAIEQRTVRGLESGGVDITGPTAPPAREQTIPGLRIAGGAAVAQTRSEDDYGDLQPVVRVLLPGREAADVAITLQSDRGGDPVRLGRHVAAGVVTDFPVPDLPDGTYTVRLRADRPLVAGARVSVVGDPSASSTPDDGASSATSTGAGAEAGTDAGLVGGDGPVDAGSASEQVPGSPTSSARGIDLAWIAAGQPLSATAAVAVGAAPGPVLTVSGGAAARTVRVTGSTTATVRVPAGGTAALPVAPGLVVLRGAEGATAAVSYAGATAVAAHPVEPADQEARPIRVTR